MATFKELQDRIALDYLNRTDLGAEIKRAIQNTIRCYEGQRFWFNETATTTACVANTSYVTVPSDFLALDRLEITHSGARIELDRVAYSELRELNVTSATGQPTHFAYRGDRFELALVPDSAYPVTVSYLHCLTTLSADTDTNAWTNAAQNLVVHGAVVELLMGVLSPADPTKVNYHQQMLKMALDELHSRNSMRISYRIEATQF